MTTLITGGSGFIGKHLIASLLAAHKKVVAFGRHAPPHFSQQKDFLEILGDLATGEGLDNIPWEEVDTVYHLAAAGVKSSRRLWEESIQVNILGTQRFLRWIQKKAVKKPSVFFAKTVYEKWLSLIPSLKENPYVVTKAASSQLAELWSEEYEGKIIFGTIHHTFGPDDDPANVLNYAARQLKQDAVATFSSGTILGDWLYIEDTISALLTAVQAAPLGVVHWDIGSGKVTPLRDLIEILRKIAGRNHDKLIFDPSRDWTTQTIEEPAVHLPPGFVPRWTLEQGLQEHYHSL